MKWTAKKHQPSLARAGVERANVRKAMPDYPPGISQHGHGPQQDAASFGYERRDGLTLPSANPIRFASRPLFSGAPTVASYDWPFGLETHECSSMLS
jgi:hypothetical protein